MTKDGLKAVKVLSQEGVKTNVTLVFSAAQGLLAALAGATYVSPFIGRLDDIGNEGMDIVEDLVILMGNYNLPTRVIAASVRHPMHVLEAARISSHIATVPYKVLEAMLRHPLTDIGIKRFLDDWAKVKEGFLKEASKLPAVLRHGWVCQPRGTAWRMCPPSHDNCRTGPIFD